MPSQAQLDSGCLRRAGHFLQAVFSQALWESAVPFPHLSPSCGGHGERDWALPEGRAGSPPLSAPSDLSILAHSGQAVTQRMTREEKRLPHQELKQGAA